MAAPHTLVQNTVDEVPETPSTIPSTPPVQTSEQREVTPQPQSETEDMEVGDTSADTVVAATNTTTNTTTDVVSPTQPSPAVRPKEKKQVRMQDPPNVQKSFRPPAQNTNNWYPNYAALNNLVCPYISTATMTSPYTKYDDVAHLPKSFTEMGTLILSSAICRTIEESRCSVISEFPLTCGTYFVTNRAGIAVAYASITLHPSNPRIHEYPPKYQQFNPFHYPSYAMMADYRCQPATSTHILCISNKLQIGEYRLVEDPSQKLLDPKIHRITLRRHEVSFGFPQTLLKKKGG